MSAVGAWADRGSVVGRHVGHFRVRPNGGRDLRYSSSFTQFSPSVNPIMWACELAGSHSTTSRVTESISYVNTLRNRGTEVGNDRPVTGDAEGSSLEKPLSGVSVWARFICST
jgi:hypothetical protein